MSTHLAGGKNIACIIMSQTAQKVHSHGTLQFVNVIKCTGSDPLKREPPLILLCSAQQKVKPPNHPCQIHRSNEALQTFWTAETACVVCCRITSMHLCVRAFPYFSSLSSLIADGKSLCGQTDSKICFNSFVLSHFLI